MVQTPGGTPAECSGTLVTSASFHPLNRVEGRGKWDEPLIPLASDNRRANYAGGSAEIARHAGRHLVKLGSQVYAARLLDTFSVSPNPQNPASVLAPFRSRVPASAFQASFYLQDQFNWTDHWTFSLGARLDHFRARYRREYLPALRQSDVFLSPRLGVAYRLGETDTVLFANFAYLYLAPPIEFFELPADTGSPGSAFPAGVSFAPTRAEKDIQYDVGVRFVVSGFRVRANQWFKRQNLFLDHAQHR